MVTNENWILYANVKYSNLINITFVPKYKN
jgi:hypothetical protein